MEGGLSVSSSTSLYSGLKGYWRRRRRGYERLNGSGRRTKNRIEYLSGEGSRRKRRRFWKINLKPKLKLKLNLKLRRFRRRNLLLNMRDAGISGFDSGFGMRQLKEYDEKVLVEIYKSMVMAQGQLIPCDAAGTAAGAAKFGTQIMCQPSDCSSSTDRANMKEFDSPVHVVITLDTLYLRGSIAAVESILANCRCRENVFFHFYSQDTNLKSSSMTFSSCGKRTYGEQTIGTPEYCYINFKLYFTESFWSDPTFSGVFDGRSPCYFNTGVMVIDLKKWRQVGYTKQIEKWMNIQKINRIYELGSMPPYLLLFAGNITPIDHKWNRHGLGSDKITAGTVTWTAFRRVSSTGAAPASPDNQFHE
ncbi:hypothetical protein HAX54_001749 [Datura stramonium]|uniref:Hexosyltransferase n=1 Tax=Datura stramonium TaxID=4076 RepID=A0ABS8RTF2_DATST|nr:hypothetical protein [Datura stramonium]